MKEEGPELVDRVLKLLVAAGRNDLATREDLYGITFFDDLGGLGTKLGLTAEDVCNLKQALEELLPQQLIDLVKSMRDNPIEYPMGAIAFQPQPPVE